MVACTKLLPNANEKERSAPALPTPTCYTNCTHGTTLKNYIIRETFDETIGIVQGEVCVVALHSVSHL